MIQFWPSYDVPGMIICMHAKTILGISQCHSETVLMAGFLYIAAPQSGHVTAVKPLICKPSNKLSFANHASAIKLMGKVYNYPLRLQILIWDFSTCTIHKTYEKISNTNWYFEYDFCYYLYASYTLFSCLRFMNTIGLSHPCCFSETTDSC